MADNRQHSPPIRLQLPVTPFKLRRFRSKLVEHDSWDKLLGEINRQLEVKNIIMNGWDLHLTKTVE